MGVVTLVAAQPGPEEDPFDPEAQIERARQAFERGRRAYETGDLQVALDAFREAHRLTGAPDLLYNIASVADRLGLDREALDAYERYLSQRPDSEDRPRVEERIASLRARVASGAPQPTSPADPEPTSEPTPPEPVLPPQPVRQRRGIERPTGTSSPEPRAGGRGVAPWVVASAGAVAVIGGAVLLSLALADVDAVESAPDGSAWSAFEARAERAPLLSGAGIGLASAGLVAIGVGVVWALLGGEDDADGEAVAVRPWSVGMCVVLGGP